MSLFRLDYILRVMKKVFGKYNIGDPSGFKEKLKVLKKKERTQKLKRTDSSTTAAKSMTTGDYSETAISKTKGSSKFSGDVVSGDGDNSSRNGGRSEGD